MIFFKFKPLHRWARRLDQMVMKTANQSSKEQAVHVWKGAIKLVLGCHFERRKTGLESPCCHCDSCHLELLFKGQWTFWHQMFPILWQLQLYFFSSLVDDVEQFGHQDQLVYHLLVTCFTSARTPSTSWASYTANLARLSTSKWALRM